MAYASFQHNKIQFGRESTAGTAVPATVIWRGGFSNISDERQRETVEEQIGVLVKAERMYDKSYLAKLVMPATALTFEQVVHLLEAGVKVATPSGAGPYVYSYEIPTGNTVNTVKSYTVEAVNVSATADYREMAYSLVEEFTLDAKAGEAWTMTGTWFGRTPVTGTATSLATLQTVEEALLMMTKVYIDATGGTVGSTQKSGVLMGANMKVKTGLVPVMTGDGNMYFSTHKFTMPEVTFSLTLELESSGVVAAERAIYEANAVRLFQLTCDGSSAARQFEIRWAGKYDKINDYTNSNGNTTVQLDGHAVYSSADTLYWEMDVTNGLATIP
jgi:hypothetical protein